MHPESDYLTVATETGLLSLALLGAIVISCFVLALRRNRGRRAWPLRLSCLLAACVVPFHGLFDVPGHRIGLALGSVLLLAMSFRPSRKQAMGFVGATCFRVAGVAILSLGLSLALVESQRDGRTALNDASIAAETIRQLHAQDEAANSTVAEQPEPVLNVGSEAASLALGDGDDKLELAIGVAEAAIQNPPA